MTIGKLFVNTFANLTQVYTRYLTITCTVGLVIGMFGSGAYELDRIKANNIAKQRFIKEHKSVEDFELSDEELATCTDSNFHVFAIRAFGPLLGLTIGITYPIAVMLSPIYYTFCSSGRSFVNSCLLTFKEVITMKREKKDIDED